MRYFIFIFICLIESCFAQDSISIFNEQLKKQENNSNLFQKKLDYLKRQDNLEEYYYAHFDYFLQNPIKSRLHFLKPIKPWRKSKTNAEKIAKLHLQVNLGYHFKKFGNIPNSIKYYQKALYYYDAEKITNYNVVDYILKPLSNNYTRIGDYTKAEEILKYIIGIVEKNKSKLVGAYSNLSILYQSIGKYQKAISILKKATTLSSLSPIEKSNINVELAKNYYELGALDKAILYANKTFKNKPSLKVKQRLLLLQGLILSKQTKYLQALKPFSAAISLTKEIYGTKNREVAKVYVLLAQTYATLNKNDKALKEFQNAITTLTNFSPNSINQLPSAKALFAENTFVDIFDGMASVYLKQKHLYKYINALELANLVSKKLRIEFTSQQSKITQQITNRNRTNQLVKTYYTLFNKEKNKAWLYKAFYLVEKNKATVLHQEIQDKQNNNQKTDSLFGIKNALEKEKATLQTNIIVEQNKQALANFELLKKWNKQITKIDTKLQSVKLTLEKKYPLLTDAKQISIAEIQKKCMLKNQLFVSYFETKEHWFVFYFDKKSDLNWVVIPNTVALKKQIKNYINLFSNINSFNNGIETYKKTGYYLFDKLLKPVLKSRYKNITIFPDGKLNFLCFNALLQEKPIGNNFSTYPYLIKNYVLNTSFSMQVLAKQNKIKTPKKEKEYVGYFPIFANNERGLQTLKNTIQEKNDLLKYTKADVFIGKSATKNNFLKEAEQYKNIHLSTHASAGNFYEPATIQFIDEPLYLSEIYGLQLNNELVVLSACETGIGKMQKGEGVMSLARGFTYAGVKNLVVSLWKVNDKSTSLLMRYFYKNKKSYPNEKSLQLAKLAYLNNKSISNLKKAPYYWAGFVFVGNVEIFNPISYRNYIIISALILLSLFLLVIRIKSKSL